MAYIFHKPLTFLRIHFHEGFHFNNSVSRAFFPCNAIFKKIAIKRVETVRGGGELDSAIVLTVAGILAGATVLTGSPHGSPLIYTVRASSQSDST